MLRWNGYRFYFFSNEGMEPSHVHVDNNIGFSSREVAELSDKVQEQRDAFLEAWRAYFGG